MKPTLLLVLALLPACTRRVVYHPPVPKDATFWRCWLGQNGKTECDYTTADNFHYRHVNSDGTPNK
jgi:hypothetical protein